MEEYQINEKAVFVGIIKQNDDETKIREYIRNQLEEDLASDQISLKEFVDPFTGEKSK